MLLLTLVVLAGAELVRRGLVADSRPAAAGATPTGSPSESPEPTPGPSPTPEPSPSPSISAPLLAAPGNYPRSGPSTWEYGITQGEVVGTAGTLRRFRVAVETGVSALGYGSDPESLAAFVESTLGDPRSWVAGRAVRFQRVPANAGHQFTIYLATGETARRMCAAGGVDIRVGGVPYTSCRSTGRVIINLSRWMGSVPEFVNRRVPLEEYRRYLINHEVGHELGLGHERCPRSGQQAPVMQKQTLSLDGCVANPWPYLNGRRYAGPRL